MSKPSDVQRHILCSSCGHDETFVEEGRGEATDQRDGSLARFVWGTLTPPEARALDDETTVLRDSGALDKGSVVAEATAADEAQCDFCGTPLNRGDRVCALTISPEGQTVAGWESGVLECDRGPRSRKPSGRPSG
jgi:hypothetical protein